jgi:hypothetical protein
MTITFKFILAALFFTLTTPAPLQGPDSLVGHWVATYPSGYKAFADFKNDGSFKSYSFAGKVEVTGKYYIAKDTFATNDGGCGIDYWGKYKITFYGADSASIAVITDSCSGRMQAISGGTLKRATKK